MSAVAQTMDKRSGYIDNQNDKKVFKKKNGKQTEGKKQEDDFISILFICRSHNKEKQLQKQ